MDKRSLSTDHKATLGCGTLILIALIVLLFGNTGDDELKDEVRGLRTDMQRLESTIRSQSEDVSRLREVVEKQVREAGLRDQ